MRKLLLAAFVLVFPVAAYTQAVDVNGKKSNPHDLSGIWMRSGGDSGFSPEKDIPPLTAAGQAKLKTAAILRTPRNNLVKQVSNAAESNDLALGCNPKGLPRLLLDTTHDYHEIIMLPN